MVHNRRNRAQVRENGLEVVVRQGGIIHRGKIGREIPMCLPLRMALTNISSVQMPSPVFWSGVKFAANDTPHGPLHAVSVGVLTIPHAAAGCEFGGAGSLKSSG
jgi:hypothetical protein